MNSIDLQRKNTAKAIVDYLYALTEGHEGEHLVGPSESLDDELARLKKNSHDIVFDILLEMFEAPEDLASQAKYGLAMVRRLLDFPTSSQETASGFPL